MEIYLNCFEVSGGNHYFSNTLIFEIKFEKNFRKRVRERSRWESVSIRALEDEREEPTTLEDRLKIIGSCGLPD